MQAFTDLVGTAAVPTHAFDMAELTELTPALDTAAIDHCLSVEASEYIGTFPTGCILILLSVALGSAAAERPTAINH